LYFSQASEQEKIATGAQTEDKLQRKEAMLPVKIYQLILKINQLIRKIHQLIWYQGLARRMRSQATGDRRQWQKTCVVCALLN